MAQIYDRIQIKNSHLFSQLTDITALARFCKKLNGTVVNQASKFLLGQHHLARLREVPRSQAIEVHSGTGAAADIVGAAPHQRVLSGRLYAIDQCFDPEDDESDRTIKDR